MNVLPITQQRQGLLNVKNWLDAHGANPDEFIISPSTLRLEALFDANTGAHTLNVKENTGNVRPQENRLSLNDLFFLDQIALNITKQNASATPPEYGNVPLFTFADPNFFTVAGEAKALQTLYSGNTEFKTSTVSRIPKILNHNFEYVPEAQVIPTGAATDLAAASRAGYGPAPEQKGFMTLGSLYIMDGSEDNKVIVSLGSGLRTAIAGTSPNVNVLVCLLQGYIVSEGARKLTQYIQANPFA